MVGEGNSMASKFLSAAVVDPVNRAHQESAMGLGILGGGGLALILSLATQGSGTLSIVFGVAAILLMGAFSVFYYLQVVSPTKRLDQQLQQHRELIDSVQDAGIGLTVVSRDMSELVGKEARAMEELLDSIKARVNPEQHATVAAYLDGADVERAVELSKKAEETRVEVESTISTVAGALSIADPMAVRTSLEDLGAAHQNVRSVIDG